MKRPTRNRLLVIALYVVLLLVGLWVGMQWDRLKAFDASTRDQAMMTQFLVIGLVLFALTSAIPFVPGAEIGFALMVVFGGKVAMYVYGAIVFALCLAYLVGSTVPASWIARFFGSIGFQKTRLLVLDLAARERHQRMDVLLASAPPKWVPVLLRHRYIALVLLFNLPGNALIGGGGGLALAAGMSGFFWFPGFVAAVLVAVAPVPLFCFLTL